MVSAQSDITCLDLRDLMFIGFWHLPGWAEARKSPDQWSAVCWTKNKTRKMQCSYCKGVMSPGLVSALSVSGSVTLGRSYSPMGLIAFYQSLALSSTSSDITAWAAVMQFSPRWKLEEWGIQIKQKKPNLFRPESKNEYSSRMLVMQILAKHKDYGIWFMIHSCV